VAPEEGAGVDTSVKDMRVLVTAGASGIGQAICDTFAAAGARIYICDVDTQALETFSRERPNAGTKVADVSSPEAVASLFDAAEAFLGGLDVLVNNAGITGPTALVENISVEEWDRTIAVDLNSMFYCVRRAVPMLKAAGGGSIINLSSIGGRLGYPLRTPYSAAKWGVVGFTKSLAIELGPANIRVNAIQPGVVEGTRVDRVVEARAQELGLSFDEVKARLVAPISLGRMVSVQDIADMALFLASPSGRSISGQALSVCGDHASLT
jgi:NAD(P)-dependent dehydrogenase (short-subunit alcohol dehydrogenase family)